MKKQFFLFYLVSLTIYLTVGALQPAGASPYSLGETRHILTVSLMVGGANGIRINTPTVTMPDPLRRT